MKNILESKTKDRKWYINLAFCLFALIGAILLPTLFQAIFSLIFESSILINTLTYIFTILVLVLMYYFDLVDEVKTFKKNFKYCFKTGFKYYIVGMMAMVFFNLIIANILGDVSTNENAVREMLFDTPIYAMISIAIFAPIEEELIFRKSLMPLFKNKYVYALICGFTFGMAHLTINILGGTFVISDLLYLLPYGSLGFTFGIMDYETKTTCTSIMIHSMHNTCTGILLLLLSFSGLM